MTIRRARSGVAMIVVAGLVGLPGAGDTIHAQDAIRMPGVSPLFHDPEATPVPFGPGERLEYQVKMGVFSVGDGYMAVEGVDTVRGHPSYHIRMGIQGGVLFAKVNDRYDSWMGTRDLVSRRYIRDIHEVNYKSRREFAIYPEERRWERVDADQGETMSTSEPLDEIAFLYFLRTLPLEVGDTYTLNRYFKDDGNPVVIKVLRRERKEVPAGTFNTIVVQPVIQTDGLFSEGGKAEVYFTDDAARNLVYLRSEIPVVGSVTLHLKSVRKGTRLNPAGPRSGGR
ncbi:MAG: DUF3108 domain-containing protein [Gemmatimonadetes bacterium]|nr:DUF3108 domain-containing protein [Gemmatimonadota bacterium]